MDQDLHGWWRRFIQRQNDLVLRKGDSTAYLRMDAVNDETLKQYYDLLEDTLEENNELTFLHIQCRWNGDTTGPQSSQIVAPVGMKKVRYQSPGCNGQITVVACGNAAGQVLPPTIIFDAKKVKNTWTKDGIPGTKYRAVATKYQVVRLKS